MDMANSILDFTIHAPQELNLGISKLENRKEGIRPLFHEFADLELIGTELRPLRLWWWGRRWFRL